MIEQVLRRKNLLQAMYKVQKNHGSAGVDHMPVTKLSELLLIDKEELTEEVRSGKYLPQAILGLEISKGEGKTRLLGIPTVTDRLLQQAVLQIMTTRFEFKFSDSSFGFRPNKNVGQAVMNDPGASSEVSNGVCFANILFSDPRLGVLNHIMNKNIAMFKTDVI